MIPRTHNSAKIRGFTLVELMVAITGGLFVSIVVFALARDGSRFYQRESRVADATLASVVGFERLRTDIARAGFLSSPNIRFDPDLCGINPNDPNLPSEIRRMASIRVTPDTPAANATLSANGLSPDSIVLSGNYSSSEIFPIVGVSDLGGQYSVDLQTEIGPLARSAYANLNAAQQLALLERNFGAGRALRIVDEVGRVQYGAIQSVQAGTNPAIMLRGIPQLTFRGTSSTVCGLRTIDMTGTANVVNFIRYDIRNLSSDAATTAGASNYAPLYGSKAPFEADRTELTRVELDVNGNAIDGTEELVAEYAVDLEVSATVAAQILNGTVTQLQSVPAGQITNWLGDTSVDATTQTQGPHRARALRVRLSIRSREADREEAILGDDQSGPLAPGLYRIGLGASATGPYARVRTMQADVALHNQMGDTW